MAGEFDLIREFFTSQVQHTDLGVGDDAAIFRVTPGMQALVSTDMLVAGTHFLPGADPLLLGWKTAAVNISDIAAMGGDPRWITLSLALPEANTTWVAAFARGFRECCETYAVDWVGGDTTRGPMVVLSASIIGEVPAACAIRRSGAVSGDDIWISGWPGLANLGLKSLLGEVKLAEDWVQHCLDHLHRPVPRVALGRGLRGLATAMLDVSDGLLGDLGHILEQSGVGAVIEEAQLPLQTLTTACKDEALALQAILRGGDDYELLFSAPHERRSEVAELAKHLSLPLWRIGRIVPTPGTWIQHLDGQCETVQARAYDHFAGGDAGDEDGSLGLA